MVSSAGACASAGRCAAKKNPNAANTAVVTVASHAQAVTHFVTIDILIAFVSFSFSDCAL
jgi:hypothetical protein